MSTMGTEETVTLTATLGHDELVSAIEARVTEIESAIADYKELVRERERLLQARGVLIDVVPPARNARLSGSAVLAAVMKHPGSTTAQLARLVGRGDNAVRAHLHRAQRAGRCVRRDRHWYSVDQAQASARLDDCGSAGGADTSVHLRGLPLP